jgi:hemerythrin-like domain-containing protein
MPNALEMLRDDHRKVQKLFEDFERSDGTGKEQIAEQTIVELETHAALEEKIFYPAAQEQIEEKELIDEAQEEHHVVKLVIAELKKMSGDDDRFDAKFKVMSESVKHHIEEEESELFPMVEDKLDAEHLGEQMQARKEQLQQKSFKRAKSASKSTRSKTGSRKRANSRRRSGKKARKASGGRR